jgi:hypothetical protein
VTVYEYEVQYTLVDRHGVQHGRTATQYAYNISDALYQTIYVAQNEFPDCRDFKVTRIGPPQRLVDLSAKSIERTLEEMMKVLARSVKDVTRGR